MCNAAAAIVVLVVVAAKCDSARILGIIPTPSYSHQVVFQPLWKELSLRGHQLTVLTTDPIKDPSLTNLTEIDLHFAYEQWDANAAEFIRSSKNNPLQFFKMLWEVLSGINEQELHHPRVQQLIKDESEHFDLLIIEFIFPTMLAFAERFKCPIIAVLSLDAPAAAYSYFGNPVHPALNPDFSLPFGEKLSFPERLMSVIVNFVQHHVYFSMIPRQQSVVEKHFGKNYPRLEDIQRNISMLFVNADSIFHRVRPLVPQVIHIGGGTHIKPSKSLPKELKKILDNASQGVIYFSLGTNVKSTDLPEKTRNIILQVFAELPYQVLWKFELDDLPGKPKNVIVSKWFPQQDIFKHPNIKLFITQGGLQSMEEAIYSYIPIVGIPFFADQPSNINRIVSKGVGLSIQPENIEKESFKNIIVEVITNPKYRNTVKKLAELALDQPMTGLERAVWWTEYVLRHKGAAHLKSPSIDLPIYQYYLLDVIGFCLLVVAIAVYLFAVLLKLSFRLLKYYVIRPKEKSQ